ncbi:hypothetical protein J2S11_000823 [Bacillus horti]|uniref:Secreted protein n=1 Tax=Caldalkalibacillus horti TaxID=77523 RepID=A0ABT9VVA2_9BACI|nr:hypothetical protein [Bacillus horti]
MKKIKKLFLIASFTLLIISSFGQQFAFANPSGAGTYSTTSVSINPSPLDIPVGDTE